MSVERQDDGPAGSAACADGSGRPRGRTGRARTRPPTAPRATEAPKPVVDVNPTAAPVEAPAEIGTGIEAGGQAAEPARAATSVAAPPGQETPETRLFSFPKFLDDAFGTGVPRMDLLAAARQLFDETFPRDSPPLPARAARMVEEMRRQFAYTDDLVSGRVSPPADTPRLFDWRVRLLLTLNYWHAVEMAGRPAVKAELVAIVKALTRGAKGRPAKIAYAQVQEMKRLWDAGQSFPQIAETLGLPRSSVRTALKHHFPDHFHKKNVR